MRAAAARHAKLRFTIMSKAQSNDATGWYQNVFAEWQTKLLGRKPTAGELASIHKLGARAGKQALASAMALRECGVTGNQIIMACGAQQLNKMRGFITDGLVKREAVPPSAAGHTVYKLTLTAKGTAKVAKADAVTVEKPAKAKAAPKAAKPRKARAAKVTPAAPAEPEAAVGAA